MYFTVTVRVHLWGLFPLYNSFAVNMMYLQIIYHLEALQTPKTMKQKALQLAFEQARYGFKKLPINFL